MAKKQEKDVQVLFCFLCIPFHLLTGYSCRKRRKQLHAAREGQLARCVFQNKISQSDSLPTFLLSESAVSSSRCGGHPVSEANSRMCGVVASLGRASPPEERTAARCTPARRCRMACTHAAECGSDSQTVRGETDRHHRPKRNGPGAGLSFRFKKLSNQFYVTSTAKNHGS